MLGLLALLGGLLASCATDCRMTGDATSTCYAPFDELQKLPELVPMALLTTVSSSARHLKCSLCTSAGERAAGEEAAREWCAREQALNSERVHSTQVVDSTCSPQNTAAGYRFSTLTTPIDQAYASRCVSSYTCVRKCRGVINES